MSERIRLSSKQKSSGEFYFETTVEWGTEPEEGSLEAATIAAKSLEVTNETIKAYRDDGKVVVEAKPKP